MGAILFIIFAVLLYVAKIIANARNLNFDKWCEIFISFFVFTNCTGFGLSIFSLDQFLVDGTWGFKFRIEVYMLIAPVFFIVMAQRKKWQFLPIPWYVVLGMLLFAAYNIFNPANMAVDSTILALVQLLCYLAFLYMICSCVPIEVIMRGVYEGFVFTTILQFLLALCYPILGIKAVVELFREEVSIRADDRPGAPGTFAHPNVLGGYMAYIVSFFTVCILLNFRKRMSIIFGAIAFFVLIFTYSRTAWLATVIAVLGVVLIYKTREGRIFTIKNIFTMILPLLALVVGIFLLTPLKDSIIGSNMDDMMLARLMHYYCGFEAIGDHPVIGVGLNAHLEYVRNNIDPRIFKVLDQFAWKPEEFMFSNPIHNIWLIIVAELGIVGTIPVIYYIVHKFRHIKSTLCSQGTPEYHVARLYTIALLFCLLVHGMADWAPFNMALRNIWILIFFTAAVGTSTGVRKEE